MSEYDLISICGIRYETIAKINNRAYKYYNNNDIIHAFIDWYYIMQKLKPLIFNDSNLQIFKNSYTIQILSEILYNIEIINNISSKDKIFDKILKDKYGIHLIKLMDFKKHFDEN